MSRLTRDARLVVVASHPIQYFTPIYQRLARIHGLQLDVLFCRDFGVAPRYDKQFGRVVCWDTDLLSGYPHRFLRNISPITDTFNPLHAVNPSVVAHVLRDCDAVWVNGYAYPTNWLAAAAARLRRVPILYRSDMRLRPDRPAGRLDTVREGVIRAWIGRSDALLYIGEANREAYLAYGAREDQLHFTPYSVDVERIRRVASAAGGARELRLKWGVDPDATVILAVAKLIDIKHPEALLHVLGEAAGRSRLHAVFAGSGPLEQALRAEAARRGLTNVTFLGFVNQQALPEVYALADIFVMPSEQEQWGLVLNEAMAGGLVSVVSDDVGAARDLVSDGETGFMFPSRDWDALARHVLRLAGDGGLRVRMGKAARVRAARYSYEATVEGIVRALRHLNVLPRMPFMATRVAKESCATPS